MYRPVRSARRAGVRLRAHLGARLASSSRRPHPAAGVPQRQPAQGRRRAVALLTASALLGGTLVLGSAGGATADPQGGLRLMPLGDSITDGYTVPGAYRTRLWQRAAADGRVNDFVGSQVNGPPELGDHDHEGHTGWRIDEVDAQVKQWVRAADPQTVLLHIGTNDLNQDFDLANAPARLAELITHVTEAAPEAEVFVADVIPMADPEWEKRVRAFNAEVPGLVQRLADTGKRVHFVPMHDTLTLDDLADGVHPDATGYAKMGDRWYEALAQGPWI